MALTAQAAITRADDIIQDQTNVRWPVPELLRWFNDGRREVAIVRPDIYAVTVTADLVAGTKQSLPADGCRFIDAVRNMPGGAAGRAVRIVEREVLDAQMPDWHTLTPSAEIRHFMFDERAPRTFYVYPPAAPGTKLEIVYAQAPTEFTAATDVLSADEELYMGAFVDYICFRAFSKDSEYAGNAQRAAGHYQQFANALGIGARTGAITSPNTANVGGMPPRAAVAAGA